MRALPEVPFKQKLSNEEILSYLFQLREALEDRLNELDKRIKELEQEEA